MKAHSGGIEGLEGLCNLSIEKTGIYKSPEISTGVEKNPLNPLYPPRTGAALNFSALLKSWKKSLGARPVLVAAVLWQACNGNEELAAALGNPLPTAKSLGRLLAARAGRATDGLRLIRCPGRIGNSALWRVEAISHPHSTQNTLWQPTAVGHDES